MIFQWLTDMLWYTSVSMVHSWSTRLRDYAVAESAKFEAEQPTKSTD